MTRFFELHPELNSACWAMAREATASKNPQKMFQQLKTEAWNHFAALTKMMYEDAPAGKTIHKDGLFLHPALQQDAFLL